MSPGFHAQPRGATCCRAAAEFPAPRLSPERGDSCIRRRDRLPRQPGALAPHARGDPEADIVVNGIAGPRGLVPFPGRPRERARTSPSPTRRPWSWPADSCWSAAAAPRGRVISRRLGACRAVPACSSASARQGAGRDRPDRLGRGLPRPAAGRADRRDPGGSPPPIRTGAWAGRSRSIRPRMANKGLEVIEARPVLRDRPGSRSRFSSTPRASSTPSIRLRDGALYAQASEHGHARRHPEPPFPWPRTETCAFGRLDLVRHDPVLLTIPIRTGYPLLGLAYSAVTGGRRIYHRLQRGQRGRGRSCS
ncbi:MAG: hypothetical protein MZU95_08580 [Desulfomicrobium escambiense]|nr:hypothetical protein [Desulfomicrobium escambiense]